LKSFTLRCFSLRGSRLSVDEIRGSHLTMKGKASKGRFQTIIRQARPPIDSVANGNHPSMETPAQRRRGRSIVAATAPDGEAFRPTVLEIVNLRKSYGDVAVLHSVSVDMKEGEFLVLLGPSGCGKSTLLNCIAGLETITEGTLKIGGNDMTSTPPKDRNIAMVFQSYALYPTMTVGENITFGMKVRKVAKDEQEREVKRVAEILQITHLLDRKPAALSGGQRQRVAMGRALVRNPKLFLFDEPLSNLDAKLRVEMRAEIKRLHETVNASIVYVTHDQVEAMTLATKIVILKDGFVQQIGTPLEIYERPANTFVAGFLGSPPMNLVPGHVAQSAEGATIRFAGAEPAQAHLSGIHGGGARDVLFGVRPEEVHAATDGKGFFGVPLPVRSVERTGSDTFATVSLGDSPMTVRLPARADVKAGDRVPLALAAGALRLFDKASGALIG
jgi:multiple sugar transport system ATP-binding protein